MKLTIDDVIKMITVFREAEDRVLEDVPAAAVLAWLHNREVLKQEAQLIQEAQTKALEGLQEDGKIKEDRQEEAVARMTELLTTKADLSFRRMALEDVLRLKKLSVTQVEALAPMLICEEVGNGPDQV